MLVLSRTELVESCAGLEWQELDMLIDVSNKKRDYVTVNAAVTELESRFKLRCPDPLGFALALRRGREILRSHGFYVAAA